MKNWREHAACRGTDPEAFFPLTAADEAVALTVCRRCTVQPECLDEALERREAFGVWGGVGEKDRQKMRAAVTA